jgi:DNA-binding NarL/FixJ family response regulator
VATAEAGIEAARHVPVDVALIDYQLGGRNGLWLSRKLKRLQRPPGVLIYSAYTDTVLAAAGVVAQADAIVSKGGLGSELCQTVREVAAGRRHLPRLPPRLAESLRRRLDHEEQTIFGMLLAGLGLTEIAHTLDLTGAELESRLGSLLRRLEVLPVPPPR